MRALLNREKNTIDVYPTNKDEIGFINSIVNVDVRKLVDTLSVDEGTSLTKYGGLRLFCKLAQ